jgi:nucleoside-diphosphate-sugar epimerase
VHAAAYGGRPGQDNLPCILETNVAGTAHLVEAGIKSGLELFINTGSSSEYGVKNSVMRESDRLDPATLYGVAKAAASLYCQQAARRHGLPLVTLRLFSPYGYFDEGSRAVSSLILSGLRQGIAAIRAPRAVRDFIFIEDVLEAYEKVLAGRGCRDGSIFNIGLGRQCSIKKLAGIITREMGGLRLVASPAKKPAGMEPKHWVADITKARAGLHWKPATPLEEGLRKTIAWFRNNQEFYA